MKRGDFYYLYNFCLFMKQIKLKTKEKMRGYLKCEV